MRKTWLVARHEFSVTLGRLAYRIFAASVPVLAIVALIGIAIFQAVSSDDTSQEDTSTTPPEAVTFGYVDLTTGRGWSSRSSPVSRSRATQSSRRTPTRRRPRPSFLKAASIASSCSPRTTLRPGPSWKSGRSAPGFSTPAGRDGALRRFVVENLFAEQVGSERLERIVTPYRLVIDEVSEAGAPADEDGDPGDTLIFIVASVLFLVSAFTASGYLLQGLTEEKENRIMEVLLSSIKPEHLMFGKLIGLGAASLLQFAVWTVAGAGFLLALNLIIDLPFELTRELVPSPGRLLVAFAYFLLGYALVGTLLAAIGAVTTNQRQAGNITAFVILPAVAPMWFMVVLLEGPRGNACEGPQLRPDHRPGDESHAAQPRRHGRPGRPPQPRCPLTQRRGQSSGSRPASSGPTCSCTVSSPGWATSSAPSAAASLHPGRPPPGNRGGCPSGLSADEPAPSDLKRASRAR